MSPGPILITSFQPWRAHQKSNSSDDLMRAMVASGNLPADVVWLRQVPVHFELASVRVISEMQRLRPRGVICCGMAESRACLSIERQAKGPCSSGHKTLKTSANVSALITGTVLSEISDDAGSYVCDRLYYDVLQFVEKASWQTTAIFVHIPVLNPENQSFMLSDFTNVVKKLKQKFT